MNLPSPGVSSQRSQTESPVVATTSEQLRAAVRAARDESRTIGLVPTMGALHEGHLGLVRAARAECDFVVVSIFVNPTQFGPSEDFTTYPRDLETDLSHCTREGVDLVFTPDRQEMYPPGFSTYVSVERLDSILEGEFRPGHFRGVATVVLKLFNLVTPDVAYFGHKDYQQTVVVRRLVRDLHLALEVRVCTTVREADGLACSSRNRNLSAQDRERALVLCRSLRLAQELIAAGERDAHEIRQKMRDLFEATPGVYLDYADLVDPDDLEEVSTVRGPTLAAVAAKVGETRLIDSAIVAP